jgi:hypothetical protein
LYAKECRVQVPRNLLGTLKSSFRQRSSWCQKKCRLYNSLLLVICIGIDKYLHLTSGLIFLIEHFALEGPKADLFFDIILVMSIENLL